MARETVKLQIPFVSLIAAVARLSLKEKQRLWESLNEQLAQAEEEQWERDPAAQAALREARTDYEAGDFVTAEEYAAKRFGEY